MNEKGIRRALFTAFFAVLLTLFTAPARAQAWLPPKGEASLAVGYGDIFVNRHYL
jgi:hypothetical protein